jgi:hypothetical protein
MATMECAQNWWVIKRVSPINIKDLSIFWILVNLNPYGQLCAI